jgi:hypothetical protein
MIGRPRFGLSIFLVALLIAPPSLAFDDPLSSTSIRDAYMLGNRKDFKTAEYFARCKHLLPMPESGPHVAAISVETPYGQVVEIGEADLNTDIQGAEQRLADKTFPFIVRVGVDLTNTYPGPPPGIRVRRECCFRISNEISIFNLFKTTKRFPCNRNRSICSIPMRSRISIKSREQLLN